MKKIIIGFIAIISGFVMGCSKEVVPRAESIESAYFAIANSIENGESLEAEYFNQLLKGYDYHKNLPGTATAEYIFASEDEFLTITCDSNYELYRVRYSNKFEENNITLNYELSDTPKLLSVYISTTDTSLGDEISSLLDGNNLELLSSYNDISKNVQTLNDLTIENVKDMLAMEPVIAEPVTAGESRIMHTNTYKQGNEKINLSYFEDEEKVVMLTYSKDDRGLELKSSNGLFIEPEIYKETITAEYGYKDTIFVSNTSLVDNVETQLKALKILKERGSQ